MAELDQGSEIARLERKVRQLGAGLAVLATVLVSTAGAGAYFVHKLADAKTLTLRQLTIVDEHGTARAILGSPAPPPMHFGRAGRRDGSVSGLLI